jgi:hypothetical protein
MGGKQKFMIVQQNHSEERPDINEMRKSYSGLFNTQLVSEWINQQKAPAEFTEYRHIHPNLIKNWRSLLLKETKHIVENK